MRATLASPNPAPSPLNGWVLNTLLGWGKGKCFILSNSCLFLLSFAPPRDLGLAPAASQPSFPCFAGAVSRATTRCLTRGPEPGFSCRDAQLLTSCLCKNPGSLWERAHACRAADALSAMGLHLALQEGKWGRDREKKYPV